jgi:hypothetical protein
LSSTLKTAIDPEWLLPEKRPEKPVLTPTSQENPVVRATYHLDVSLTASVSNVMKTGEKPIQTTIQIITRLTRIESSLSSVKTIMLIPKNTGLKPETTIS